MFNTHGEVCFKFEYTVERILREQFEGVSYEELLVRAMATTNKRRKAVDMQFSGRTLSRDFC